MLRVGLRDVVVAAVVYAMATVAVTWPLFRHPGTTVLETRTLYGPAIVPIQRDVNLTMWILAWDVHALGTAPGRLFDANAFWPAPASLARSEHMLGNVPLFGPVYVATGNPVLAHQTTLLASFVLSGLAMAAWAFRWTRDRAAALVAGLAFTAAPVRLWQMGNLQVVSTQYLPLVLLAVDALVARRARAAATAILAGALVLSVGCSYYVGYAALVAAAVYAGVRVAGERAWHAALPLAVAAVIVIAIVLPLSLPYLRLQHAGGLPAYDQPAHTSLALLGMLKHGVAGLLSFFVWPRRDGIPQFLGWTVLALAGVAAVRPGAPRDALAALLATGVVLSLGPFALVPGGHGSVPLPYRLLQAVVPGFSAMRAPQRMGVVATLAAAALAGLGLARLRAALAARERPHVATAIAVAAAALVLLEARVGGLEVRGMRTCGALPPAYPWLAAHGDGGALLELPLRRADLQRESVYMYYSTFHWLPIANGYSSYPPPEWIALANAAADLPSAEAVDAVLAPGERWVLFHRDGVPANEAPRWEAALGARLRRVDDFGDAVLYERAP